jgi:hypothetical protein
MLVELIISNCRFDGLARLTQLELATAASFPIKIVSCHCIITVIPRTWPITGTARENDEVVHKSLFVPSGPYFKHESILISGPAFSDIPI